MKKILAFGFIVTVLFFSGCKSKKTITEGERASSTSHLITLIQQAQPTFTSMNANSVKVNLNMNGQAFSSPAGIKIITDSIIVIAAYPFLGMEMFSVELYPDRWIIYDKMNLKYVTDNYQFFALRYGVNINFHDLQSIFSAQLFEIGSNAIDYKNYTYTMLGGNRSEIIYNSPQMMQTTRISHTNTIENVVLQSKNQSYLLTVGYNDYTINKGVNFPQNMKISASTDKSLSLTLDVNIQKVSFNSDVKLSLANPDRYTRTTIDKIFTK